ncbi:MAG TPA: extracellular solute-binding protein [Anaerolineae bacterium]|nr:extracellular solute-binding protein [Anaerolineae bacterium]HQH39425.1 extracellular solute-binding protein [Anaerolineae bacterium]
MRRWHSSVGGVLLALLLEALAACAAPFAEKVVETVVVTREVDREVVVTREVTVEVPVEKIVALTPTPLTPVVVSITDAALAEDNIGIQRQRWLLEQFHVLRPEVVIDPHPYRYERQTFITRTNSPLEDTYAVPLTDARALIEGGYAADITGYVADTPYRAAYHPAILALAQDAYGNIYGLPHAANGLGLMYNRRLFAAVGLDPDRPPRTWDEVRAYARQIHANLDGVDGFNIRNEGELGGWMSVALMVTYGGETIQAVDGQWVAAYNNEAMVAAMQFMHDLRWQEDATTSDITAWGNYALVLDFVAGKVAMTIADADTLGWMIRNLDDLAMEEVGFGRMPDGGANATLGAGRVWLYNPTSAPEVLEAALAFNTWREFDLAAFENAVQLQAANGAEVGLPYLNVFTGEYGQQRAAIIEKYANVPVANYADFINSGMAVRGEPPVAAQQLYEELGQVLRQVLAAPHPDIKAMLNASAASFQVRVLDGIHATQNGE